MTKLTPILILLFACQQQPEQQLRIVAKNSPSAPTEPTALKLTDFVEVDPYREFTAGSLEVSEVKVSKETIEGVEVLFAQITGPSSPAYLRYYLCHSTNSLCQTGVGAEPVFVLPASTPGKGTVKVQRCMADVTSANGETCGRVLEKAYEKVSQPEFAMSQITELRNELMRLASARQEELAGYLQNIASGEVCAEEASTQLEEAEFFAQVFFLGPGAAFRMAAAKSRFAPQAEGLFLLDKKKKKKSSKNKIDLTDAVLKLSQAAEVVHKTLPKIRVGAKLVKTGVALKKQGDALVSKLKEAGVGSQMLDGIISDLAKINGSATDRRQLEAIMEKLGENAKSVDRFKVAAAVKDFVKGVAGKISPDFALALQRFDSASPQDTKALQGQIEKFHRNLSFERKEVIDAVPDDWRLPPELYEEGRLVTDADSRAYIKQRIKSLLTNYTATPALMSMVEKAASDMVDQMLDQIEERQNLDKSIRIDSASESRMNRWRRKIAGKLTGLFKKSVKKGAVKLYLKSNISSHFPKGVVDDKIRKQIIGMVADEANKVVVGIFDKMDPQFREDVLRHVIEDKTVRAQGSLKPQLLVETAEPGLETKPSAETSEFKFKSRNYNRLSVSKIPTLDSPKTARKLTHRLKAGKAALTANRSAKPLEQHLTEAALFSTMALEQEAEAALLEAFATYLALQDVTQVCSQRQAVMQTLRTQLREMQSIIEQIRILQEELPFIY